MWQIHFSPDLSEPVALVSTSCGTSCCASLAVASVSAERGDLSSYPSRSFQTLPNSKNEGLCSRWGFLFLPGPPSALQRACSERQWRMWLWQLWLLQVPRRQVEVGFWSCLEVCIERRRTPNPSLRQSCWFVLWFSWSQACALHTPECVSSTTATYGSGPGRGSGDGGKKRENILVGWEPRVWWGYERVRMHSGGQLKSSLFLSVRTA